MTIGGRKANTRWYEVAQGPMFMGTDAMMARGYLLELKPIYRMQRKAREVA